MTKKPLSKKVRKYALVMPLLIVVGVVLNWLIGQPCALLKLPLLATEKMMDHVLEKISSALSKVR